MAADKRTDEELFNDVFTPKTESVVDSSAVQASSSENVQLIQDVVPQVSLEESGVVEAPSQKARAFAGGLTFQFADELEAFAVSLLNDNVSYEEAKAEINKK